METVFRMTEQTDDKTTPYSKYTSRYYPRVLCKAASLGAKQCSDCVSKHSDTPARAP
jgi:hypothetical protein